MAFLFLHGHTAVGTAIGLLSHICYNNLVSAYSNDHNRKKSNKKNQEKITQFRKQSFLVLHFDSLGLTCIKRDCELSLTTANLSRAGISN